MLACFFFFPVADTNLDSSQQEHSTTDHESDTVNSQQRHSSSSPSQKDTNNQESQHITHSAIKEYLSDPLAAKILDKIYQTSGPYSTYIDSITGSSTSVASCGKDLNCSKCSLSDTCEKITKDCLSFPSPTPSELWNTPDVASENFSETQSHSVDIPSVSPTLNKLTEEYYRENYPNHVDKYFEDTLSDIDTASLVCHDPAHCSDDSDNCDTKLFLDDILFDGYPYDIYPHLRNSKLPPRGNDMKCKDTTDNKSPLCSSKRSSIPVRNPNAEKFSFTKACLEDLMLAEQDMDNKRIRFQQAPDSDSDENMDIPDRPPSPRELPHKRATFSLANPESPNYQNFESPNQNSREMTLEEEMKRPEVQALMRKYNPGSPLQVHVNPEEADFQVDPDLEQQWREDERNRQEYRQKVGEHYRRLLEEQVLTPDAEYLNRSWSSSLDGSVQRDDRESPGYKVGIDESDWREIDHQRSRSLERSSSREHLNRACNSLSASLERPLGLIRPEEEKKPNKKVRITTQDSMVKSDSAPDLQYEEERHQNPEERYHHQEGRYQNQDPEELAASDLSLSVYEDAQDEVDEMDTDDQVEYNRHVEARAARKDYLQPTTLTTRPPRPKSAHERPKPHIDGSPQHRRITNHSPVSDSGYRRHGNLEEYYHTLGSESSDRSSRLDPHTYQSYAAGILHSSSKSETFLNLQKHYATMERIAEIEEQTLENNMESGKPEVNIMNPQARSLGSLAPQSKADALLLSKYKLENLWELKELYADLDEAQEDGEFFYDTKNLDRIQWNPWKDIGLNVKELSLQDLQDLYESGRNINTKTRKRYEKDPREFKRQLSFGKLRAKYMHLDEETQKQRLLDDWLHSRFRSRRSSDASTSTLMSTASVAGSYIEIMENAAKKAKERPLYGYYVDEVPNRYEKHVGMVSTLAKSCPDITVQAKRRSRSSGGSVESSPTARPDLYRDRPVKPKSTLKVSNSPTATKRASPNTSVRSSPQPSTSRRISNSSPLKTSSLSPQSRHNTSFSPRDEKTPPWRKHSTGNTLSPTAKSSESGYDSLDSKTQKQLSVKLETPLNKRESLSPRPTSESDNERKQKGKSPVKSNKRRNSLERRDSFDSIDGKVVSKRGKSRSKPKWQPGEIRGVIGLPPDNRSDSPRSYSSAGTNDNEIQSPRDARARNDQRKMADNPKNTEILQKSRPKSAIPFSSYQDQNAAKGRPFNDDEALAKRKNDLNRRMSRKDSKPDPGSVSQAISMFKSLENFDDPPWKSKSNSLRSRSYDILEEPEKSYVVKSAYSGYTPKPDSKDASLKPQPPRRTLPEPPASNLSPKPSKSSPRSSLSMDKRRYDTSESPMKVKTEASPSFSSVKTSTPLSNEPRGDAYHKNVSSTSLSSPQSRSKERSLPRSKVITRSKTKVR